VHKAPADGDPDPSSDDVNIQQLIIISQLMQKQTDRQTDSLCSGLKDPRLQRALNPTQKWG